MKRADRENANWSYSYSGHCAHLIALDWQIVTIVQFDNAARHDANHRGTVLPLYANALSPTAESLRGHERESTTYFRGIGHNLLLGQEWRHDPKCTDEKNDFHTHLS